MQTRSANIFAAARELLARTAPHSGNSSKHKSGMGAQAHALLSAPKELGRRHDGSKECTAAIKDVREALAAEQHADAAFDPRADEHWSRW